MNELALFAGAGGGILGGKILGWRTVCAVEWEPYPASVLCARQNDGLLPPFPIWDDVQTFDGKPWKGIIDVVSGGFPCQDISSAGQGAGIGGERSSMWKHMARIIGEEDLLSNREDVHICSECFNDAGEYLSGTKAQQREDNIENLSPKRKRFRSPE